MLLMGATGGRNVARVALKEALGIANAQDGWHLGQTMGRAWHKNRFHAPYARNTLWEVGYAVDTLETALPWANVAAASQAIPQAIVEAAHSVSERVVVMTHLSHIYRDGASIYTTYLFRRCSDPDELITRWQAMKHAASLAIQAHGGTISHQHGVGTDHAPYLMQEKGSLGMAAIRSLCQAFDPEGMMNPGKLF